MTSANPTFYIFDAHSAIFRIFHGSTLMVSPSGSEVNAVNGLIRFVDRILQEHQPDFVAAAFECKGPTFRHEIYPWYKAQRPPVPEELTKQLPLCRRVFQAFQIPTISADKMEADDIIATLVKAGEQEGYDVVIVTSDKDLRQLLSDKTTIYDPRKGHTVDASYLMHEWGIEPGQVVDYLSMMGDVSDNVAGIPGIGPKYASKYIQQFGSLDNLLESVEEVKENGKRKSISENKEIALKAREVVRLNDRAPIKINWDDMLNQGIDNEAMDRLCRECGINF